MIFFKCVEGVDGLAQDWPAHGTCVTNDMGSCCGWHIRPRHSVKGGTEMEAGEFKPWPYGAGCWEWDAIVRGGVRCHHQEPS